MAKYLYAIIIITLVICNCFDSEYTNVQLELYGLILPGKTTSENNIIAKFIWKGGGWLQEIAEVRIDRIGNNITIVPYGLLRLKGGCTDDIFIKVDTISLGPLSEGSYNIMLIGSSFTYYDTLIVPVDAPDSLYQFRITAISLQTSETVPNLPIWLGIDSPVDTTLVDTTDSSGFAMITYTNSNIDSVHYYMVHYYVLGETWAKLGIPEIFKLGVDE